MKKKMILSPHKGLVYGYLVPLLTGGLFIALIAVSIFVVYYQAKDDTGVLISQEIQRLQRIFERIDATCTITGFDYPKNPINFLTIKKDGFVGSEVGSMNLANPAAWEGPYVQDNPVIQGQAYQLVVTNKGIFITPGDGVKLPSGKVIGKDIVLNEQTDILALMAQEEGLLYKGAQLAAQLVLKESALTPRVTPDWAEELV